MSNQSMMPPPDTGFEIDLMRLLRKRWGLIAFGLCICMGIAVAYQLTARHIFEAQMEILVGQRSSELTAQGTSMSGGLENSILREDMLATHMELLRSQRVLNEAIKVGEFNKLNSFVEARAEDIPPLELILDCFNVERGGDGAAKTASVLRATYSDPSPTDAAHILQTIFDCYKQYVESQTKGIGAEAAELIRESQLTNEIELQKATEDYRVFVAGSTGLIEGEKLTSVHHDRLKDIEKELTEIRSQLAYSKSRSEIIGEMALGEKAKTLTDLDRLALLSEKEVERLKLFLDVTRGETQSEQFQADQPVRSEKARTEYNNLLSLILKEQSLTADFGDDHPLVENVRKEIASIKRFIQENAPGAVDDASLKKLTAEQMLQAYASLLSNDVNELSKRQVHLLAEATSERVKAKSVETEFLKGQALKAKLERAQDRYDEVMERLQEIKLTADYAGFSTDLLAAPVPPEKKAWPKPLIVLALGGFAGMLFGGSLALWAEYSDQTFRDPGDLQRSIGVPILAHLPRFKVTRKDRKQAKEASFDPVCRAFYTAQSVESEVFRMARTSLLMHAKHADQSVFMVTSPMPGDGKSTMIVNLAIAVAQAGKKVLIIDADMRRPTLHKVLGVRAEKGLSDYLQGECELPDATIATVQPNLDFMQHGNRTDVPAELLESFSLERLIEEARQVYDFVFFDSPPLLAVADPLILASQVDAALLVIRILKNGRRPVERSYEMLKANDVTVTGVIVNGSERGDQNFGYGEYVRPYEYGYATEYTKTYQVKPLKSKIVSQTTASV